MKKKFRLTRNEDFQRVRKEGQSWANRLLVLCALPNGLAYNRYGFAVGRRIGKAVVRNRIKRLLREAVQQRHPRIQPGWDLVFIARGPVEQANFQNIDQAVVQLLQRASLLREDAHENDGAETD